MREFNSHESKQVIWGRRVFIFCALLFFVPAAAFSAPFQVNTTTSFNQGRAVVAMDGSGNYVIVWAGETDNQPPSTGSGTPSASIYARRFDSANTALEVSDVVIYGPGSTAFDDTRASVAMTSGGSAWITAAVHSGGSGTDIRRYAFGFSGGLTGGVDVTLDNSAFGQIYPDVAVNDSGTTASTWSSFNGGNYDVKANYLNAGNVTVAGTGSGEIRSSIAVSAAGNYVVLWEEGGDIYGRVFDSSDAEIKAKFQVNSTSGATESNVKVAVKDNGDSTVVWEANGDIYMRRFAGAGTAITNDIRINQTTAGTQFAPDIAMDSDGNFVVTWVSLDGATDTVYTRAFNSSGAPDGNETVRAVVAHDPRTDTLQNLANPAVALNDAGQIALAWTSYDAGTTSNEVFADAFSQAFTAEPTHTAIWNGGAGTWSTASSWSGGVSPQNGSPLGATYEVIIDGNEGINSAVTLNQTGRNINRLTIGAGDSLTFANDADLQLNGNSFLSNAGLISMNGGANDTRLTVANGTVYLVNGGTFSIGSAATNVIAGSGAAHLYNVDNVIQGGGQIGLDLLQITNDNLIHANLNGVTMTINPSASGMTNNGVLRAGNGGILQLAAAPYANSNGLIEALTSSRVDLGTGVAITGGTLTSSGTGQIMTDVNANVTLNQVELSNGSLLNISNDSVVTLGTTFTNNGIIRLNTVANITQLNASGATTTITGTGTIELNNNVNNQIAGSGMLIFDTGQTVLEGGSLGLNTINIENRGLIHSNSTGELTIDPLSTFHNTATGILRATGSGGMQLNAGTYTNDNVFEAQTGSQVRMASGVTINGGTLLSSDTGNFSLNGNANVTMNDVLLNTGSILNVSNDAVLTLQNTFTNNGDVRLNGGVNITQLLASGTSTLVTGMGTVTLGNATTNQIEGSGLYISDVNQTISGAGNIGVNAINLENRGLILANQTNPLILDPVSTFTNTATGILRATGSGGMQLNAGTYTNANVFEAQTGSQMRMASGVTINGGTLLSSGTGNFSLNGNANVTMNGVTLNTGSILNVSNDADFTLQNTFTNNGDIRLNGGVNITQLLASGTSTLVTGTGTVTLSNATTNQIAGSGLYISDVNQTISGAGNIGVNAINFENRGLILANQTNPLILDPVSTFTNTATGILRATGSGGMQLNAGTYTNANVFEAQTGSQMRMASGVTINGGTLLSSGTGNFSLNGNANVTMNGVTLNTGSILNVSNDADFTLQNTFTNNGDVRLNGTANVTQLLATGSSTLVTGTGSVTLSNATTNQIAGSGLYISDVNQTISGAGNIGVNAINLENRGLILANNTVQMVIDPASTFTNTATGIVRATGSGGITLNAGTYNNSSLIEAQTGSQVRMASGVTINGGTMTSSGTGNFSVNGNANVTLNGVSFGSGASLGVSNDAVVTLLGTLSNDGNLQLNGGANVTQFLLGNDVTLTGTGTVTIGNAATNQFTSSVSTRLLTNDTGHTIRGGGLLGVNSMRILNNGTIDANVSGITMTIDPTDGAAGFVNNGTLQVSNGGTIAFNAGTYENNGIFRANAGSTLNVTRAVGGTGGYDANGGKIQLGAFTYGQPGATGALTVATGGELELNGSALYGGNLTVAAAGILDINSSITLTGNYSFTNTVESEIDWGPGSFLQMNGGIGLTQQQVNLWPTLEVGGTDFGTDPVNHVGAPGGFSNNFDLTKLVIGPDAHISLVDAFNNGNRGGVGGNAEALYVDTLEFTNVNSTLNLNGLHIYYNTLVGSASQILANVLNTLTSNNGPTGNFVQLANSYGVFYDAVLSDGNTEILDFTDTYLFLADPIVGALIDETFKDFQLSLGADFDDTNGKGALVKIPYAQADFDSDIGFLGYLESQLRVFHRNALGQIEDVTATADILARFGISGGPVDTVNNFVYGFTTSFSPLGVGVNPEPSTVLLLLLALGGIGWRRFTSSRR